MKPRATILLQLSSWLKPLGRPGSGSTQPPEPLKQQIFGPIRGPRSPVWLGLTLLSPPGALILEPWLAFTVGFDPTGPVPGDRPVTRHAPLTAEALRKSFITNVRAPAAAVNVTDGLTNGRAPASLNTPAVPLRSTTPATPTARRDTMPTGLIKVSREPDARLTQVSIPTDKTMSPTPRHDLRPKPVQ